MTAGADARQREAEQRGESEIDLEYRLPAQIGPAVARIDVLLDEADAYCREGEQLLSLAPSRESVAYRKWFLGEFVRQVAGEPAVPWPDSPWSTDIEPPAEG
jgi:hypothetical protein